MMNIAQRLLLLAPLALGEFDSAHAAKNSSRSLSTELLDPETRLDDAARIAQAIAERMDPEWREFVNQEQRQRSIASLGRSEAQPAAAAQGFSAGRKAGVQKKRS